MDEQTIALDRRRETRMFAAGLMSWRRGDASHWGLLNNNTHESIAFVTPGEWRPGVGECIEVECKDAPARNYRVARIAPFEKTLVLVACTSDWLD